MPLHPNKHLTHPHPMALSPRLEEQTQNYGGNQYAQGGQGGNPYAQQQQYGQQEQYAMGGVGNGQSGGGDFWSELTNTNQNLTLLQEQIQAVRSAHQKSLVSPHCLLLCVHEES
jgi:hypothetical protein